MSQGTADLAGAPVQVRVQQLSGRELFAESLDPSVTVRRLQAEVERRLGASYALHGARLCVGTEQLPADASVAQLAGRRPGGGAVVLDAVVTRSTEKAEEFGREVEELSDGFLHDEDGVGFPEWALAVGGLVEKYVAALELVHRATEGISDDGSLLAALESSRSLYDLLTVANDFELFRSALIKAGKSELFQRARDFFAVSESLRATRVHLGERRLKDAGEFFRDVFSSRGHLSFSDDVFSQRLGDARLSIYGHDVFTVPVLAAIKGAEFSHVIGSAWNIMLEHFGDDPLPPRAAEREALEWIARNLPQAAVREAARELELSRQEPLRTAAEAPEQQRPGAQREAAEAAAVERGADGAPAAGASGDQEVEQVAEAIAQSEAEAIQQEQAQLQEALLRSKEGWAPPAVDVVVLQYNHCKSWLRDALLSGTALQEERDALKAAGFEPALQSGAKIFVPPEVYSVVAEFFDEGWDLKCSHVIVAAESESKVHSAVDAAHKAAPRNERGRNKIIDRKAITVPSASDASVELSEDTVEYHVVRTFVQIAIPNSMRSASSFQPWSV